MVAAAPPPLTNEALADLVDAHGYYRFPASLSEYWQLLADAEYCVEYYDHEIITTMSYESDLHSQIASEFNFLLRSIFTDKSQFLVYNSNRPVYIPNCLGTKTGAFNADGMVVAMPRQPHEYRPGLSAETNPILLIEILSPSTRAYDFGTKLPCYKQIESLQTILFIEQDKPLVTVMERQAPNQWIDITFQQATDSFVVAGTEITLEQIYQDVYF
jgi:Uma2 family endonuclease